MDIKDKPPGTCEYESRERVDEGIFRTAQYYAIAQKHGIGQLKRTVYRTYPEAMMVALALHREDAHPMLYVISGGLGFFVPPVEYEKYLNLYNQLTGQKLLMPEQPKINSPFKSKKVKHRG